MRIFNTTTYDSLEDFVYSKAKNPVILKNGMVIGGGMLYPEINFTLPTMTINKETMPQILGIYKEIATGICQRAHELHVPGFVAEIETLPPMTFNPQWGIDVCSTVADVLNSYSEKYGYKASVRITPNDIREGDDLEHMWHGRHWDSILNTFEGCAKNGAELLAIESVGGKEVHDEAVMFCDISKSIFALSVLGCKDMGKLWTEIVRIADSTGTIASGDTACGFANTAMVLADRNYIPKTFAAVVRVVSAIRSLVAIECGAKGPHKDCGYEGVFVKAISGIPISMEGKASACAHLSPVGNVASCLADLWSNESIQHIKLLGGMAPTVCFEQLAYDCRLMNEASSKGNDKALFLRDCLADSDSLYDPQAYVLRPDVVLDISKQIMKEKTYYDRAKRGAIATVGILRKAYDERTLKLDDKELDWMDRIYDEIEDMPKTEQELTELMIPLCEKLNPEKYDLI
ncbi:MAG TPA: methyltransferase MtaB domain-containing protein [Clostridia bacterium]|nr:methanol--corrinoid methyltransferase [Clostridia bacterium]MDD4502217.1 methyltransferase MtaB domain-containing protein [Clostridia bacterium]HQM95515.1 methyltransferase MtaB domain-containing protein [Clostridia bacterium]HQO69752.1 methyltransferase MtaB domain-containing protein [Clostridia bacterium]